MVIGNITIYLNKGQTLPVMNIRLDIEYNGKDFSGWQYQPNVVTIQGELEKAIEKVTGQEVTLYGAGRTDAGVHALGQVANFHIEHHLPAKKYRDAINYYLPQSILVKASATVPDEFNARKSAVWRYYRYIIGRRKSALYFDYRWEYTFPLDLDRMNQITAKIIGRHDFSAFCTVSSQKENNDCDVKEAGWEEKGEAYVFEIKANRFLHNMVRSLVGIMVEAGKAKDFLTLENFKDIMESGDHTRIKQVAPARGLYLVAVGY
jgi:tRNA pseudouridine38-40 synthase